MNAKTKKCARAKVNAKAESGKNCLAKQIKAMSLSAADDLGFDHQDCRSLFKGNGPYASLTPDLAVIGYHLYMAWLCKAPRNRKLPLSHYMTRAAANLSS